MVSALSLLQDKETLKQEILVAKEAMELARHKFGPMEEENKRLQDEIDKVREVGVWCSKGSYKETLKV